MKKVRKNSSTEDDANGENNNLLSECSSSSQTLTVLHCKHRKKVYKHSSSLSRHVSSCIGIKHFKCTKCDKEYPRKDTLDRHTPKCKGKDKVKFVCPTCGREFPRKFNLQRHLPCENRCSKCCKKITDTEVHTCNILTVVLAKPNQNKKNKKKIQDDPMATPTIDSQYEIPADFFKLVEIGNLCELDSVNSNSINLNDTPTMITFKSSGSAVFPHDASSSDVLSTCRFMEVSSSSSCTVIPDETLSSDVLSTCTFMEASSSSSCTVIPDEAPSSDVLSTCTFMEDASSSSHLHSF